MKKSLVSLMIGLLMSGVSGNVWAGSVVAADLNCTNPAGCVQTGEISNSAVTNSKIADDSVTNAKIGGTISASKVEKPANVVVVAKSGGDYTTINAAMAAINPTATNPFVIKVMPGTYKENDSIVMKSYVHLQGAGKDVTTVQPTDYPYYITIVCAGITHVTISGFTITTSPHAYSIPGVYISGSTFVTVENNHFTGSGLDGIHDVGSTETTIIRGNIFTGMGSYYNPGITVGDEGGGSSSPVITGNLFRHC